MGIAPPNYFTLGFFDERAAIAQHNAGLSRAEAEARAFECCIHASIHNHFNQDRHLNCRDIFKQYRSAALAEWRQLAA